MTDTLYEPIPNSEVQVDADINSVTWLKYRDRETALKEIADGDHYTKIPGQSMETQAPASGNGLSIDRFNHELASGTLSFAAALPPESKDADTGIAASQNKFPNFTFEITSGDGDFEVTQKQDTAGGNFRFRVTRSNQSAILASIDWQCIAPIGT